PYPILILEGEAGSAKSTPPPLLRALVGPSTSPLRAISRDERDLMISPPKTWLLNFHNLSPPSSAFSGAPCRPATGRGPSTRELYTDSDEVIFDAKRPVILNGIENLASRADLADRSLVVTLNAIAEERRRRESELWASFGKDLPFILGSLLDAVSTAMRNE